MKKIICLIISCLLLQVAVQAQPKRVILFGIDGLHWEAPQRLKMPVLNDLINQGDRKSVV